MDEEWLVESWGMISDCYVEAYLPLIVLSSHNNTSES